MALGRNKILFLLFIFLGLQFFILVHANAEYRVFKLGVTLETGTPEQEVLTTLDNIQYETYYKFTATQKTRIIDHWMCWGPTDTEKPYCEKPLRPSMNAVQASK